MRIILSIAIFILGFASIGNTAHRHCRDIAALPDQDQEFAQKLSTRFRKIFCGQFNQAQRDETLKIANEGGFDNGSSPDDAVLKVMEETGMSLAFKGRPTSKRFYKGEN